MKNFKAIAAGVFGLVMFSAPFASAMTLTVDSLLPGTSVFAKNDVTFTLVSSVFPPRIYQVNDSFGNSSSVTLNNIDQAGRFSWNPGLNDVGTHTLTFVAQDYVDPTTGGATVTQTITVLPPPSISIQSVSPGNKIAPGTAFSFTVVPTGFTNPTYIVSDSFNGSSIGNVTIGSSGNLTWTPLQTDDGKHTITVYASDSLGHSNSASVDIVVGTGDLLMVGSITPGVNVPLGQNLTFNVVAIGFAPTSYSVMDNFPGSTVSNANINTSGNFSWLPSGVEAGTHVLTITGQIGAFGESASTTQTIVVLGPGGVAVPSPATTTTSTLSLTALSALQAQLAQINAQIAAQSSVTPTASTPPSGSFVTYLYQGMDGDEVSHLQTVLTKEGFFSGDINGHFGPITVAAVEKFQAAHGLSQLGVVGPATRAALNALASGAVEGVSTSTETSASSDKYIFENFIALGQHGTDVTELQKRLITLGLLTGDATGYFGTLTEAAVKAFQTAHSIDPKGWVGPGTRAELNK